MNRTSRPLRCVALFLLAMLVGAAEIDDLPVLHAGRVKPLAVAAEEVLLGITGKVPFGEVSASGPGNQSITTRIPASTLLLYLAMDPAGWNERPLVQVPWLALRERLGLAGQWASIAQLEGGRALIDEAVGRKQTLDRSGELQAWSRDDQAAYEVAGRWSEALDALGGRSIALAPLAVDDDERRWLLNEIAPRLDAGGHADQAWRGALRAVIGQPEERRIDALRRADPWLSLGDLMARPDPLLFVDGAAAGAPRRLTDLAATARAWAAMARGGTWDAALHTRFIAALRASGLARVVDMRNAGATTVSDYPSQGMITLELSYIAARPFTWAWIAFVLGGIVLACGAARATPRQVLYWRVGVALTLLALLCTTMGLATRVTLTGLGAVTNLYETLIYVALLVSLLGLWLSRSTGQGAWAAAGGLAAGLCAAIGEAMPPELGSHIGQLQPVLRSRFWLWVHVKVVVASYAAFVLAWAVGNVVLWQAWRQRRQVGADEGRALYRCLQVGLVLMIAGTLLGGVWADQAWGRFWGWDPKEIGALIVCLVYLIPLHLRYIGAVGHTGLAAWSVLGVVSVVWSWYGINFILATGLHAYAFGTSSGIDKILVGGGVLGQTVLTAWQLRAIQRARVHSPQPGAP